VSVHLHISKTRDPNFADLFASRGLILAAAAGGGSVSATPGTIRYDTRCYFDVRSKADVSQLNLPHGNPRKLLEFEIAPGNTGNLLDIGYAGFVDTLGGWWCRLDVTCWLAVRPCV